MRHPFTHTGAVSGRASAPEWQQGEWDAVDVEYLVIGGGIVGLATALALLRRRPSAQLVVLEKEAALGTHQSGHNSGVIHAGIYYPPGSLKAQLCRAGAAATTDFCAAHGIPFKTPGKLVVATTADELGRLEELRANARENRIDVEEVSAADLRALEPHITGLAALLVPGTGIVDYRRIVAAMAQEVRSAGGHIETGRRVHGIQEEGSVITVRAGPGTIRTRRLVACAGLQADRVAALAAVSCDVRMLPFRGEYHRLPPERAGLVDHLIYPVPQPGMPFLGVHLSPSIDGGITLGPNAVLGRSREGYRKRDVSLRDLADLAAFPGTWRMAREHARTGLGELRDSLWRAGYLARCRRYCPELTLADLRPHPAGIRAQAVRRDGTLVHDFLLARTTGQVHVLNAPSPAATSALPIGEYIAAELLTG